MILQLVVIACVALIAYWWAGQGALSALLHLVCVIAAGAVAFAVWEIVVIRGLFPMNEMFYTSGWSIGLVLPFVITLAILRVISDKVVSSNITLNPNLDFALGGVIGAAAGIITIGIMVIGIGFAQLPAKFLGLQQYVSDSSKGNITKSASLWLPVDTLTEKFYDKVSLGAFASKSPLPQYEPDLAAQANLIRMNYDNGKSKNSMQNGDASVDRIIKVTAPNVQELFKYSSQDSRGWFYEDPWNGKINKGEEYIIVMSFKASAREKSGSMAVGDAQFRLIIRNDEGDTKTVLPMAVIAQSKSTGNPVGRFRFDSPELFIGSIAGENQPTMGFEYIVPEGYKPVYMQARQLRLPLPMDKVETIDVNDRNRRIADGSLFSTAGKKYVQPDEFVTSNMKRITDIGRGGLINPNNSLGHRWSLLKDRLTGLKVNKDRLIISGRQRFALDILKEQNNRTVAISRFYENPGEKLVQVNVSYTNNNPMAMPSPDSSNQVPLLIDSTGNQYTAVGYIYIERDQVEISYDISKPILKLNDLPSISKSRTDQTLILLFSVRAGVTLERMSYGPDVRAEFRVTVRGGR
ncbi:MAG TPA: CvpA family protein [Phycisphaeraceae bacterium]|nr:CvpA family protein [Phycisphaeraceae bacterium]